MNLGAYKPRYYIKTLKGENYSRRDWNVIVKGCLGIFTTVSRCIWGVPEVSSHDHIVTFDENVFFLILWLTDYNVTNIFIFDFLKKMKIRKHKDKHLSSRR